MYIDHINIKAPKELLEREKQFFCDLLGLREGHKPKSPVHGYWLYSGDTAIVHLTESQLHFHNERQGYFDHVAFRTTGLKNFIARLEKMEIDYSSSYISEKGITQLFFTAPSATKIEVNFINEKI